MERAWSDDVAANDLFARRLLDAIERHPAGGSTEVEVLTVTACGACGGIFPIAGPRGLVRHSLEHHPWSSFARIVRAVLDEGSA